MIGLAARGLRSPNPSWPDSVPLAMFSRRSAGPDGETIVLWLAVAVALITAVCLVSCVATRLLHRRRRYSQALLFAQLCNHHGLDRASRRLLVQVARQHRLAQPAQVFVDPKWLDPAAATGNLQGRQAALEALRGALFGALEC